MFAKIICVVLFASSALCRNVPDFRDLDEEEQMLFRAAYDSYDTPSHMHDTPSYNHYTPSYNHDTYSNYGNDIPIGKLDLLKDGIWALKTKMNELKAFDKALAANLLLTKIQLKELLAHGLKPLKKHQHVEVDSKPAYNYQVPSQQSYSHDEQPHPQYPAPAPQYTAPKPQYTAPAPQYTPPVPQYTAPKPQYTAPAPQYTPTAPQYTAQHYGAPQPVHDPYYGN